VQQAFYSNVRWKDFKHVIQYVSVFLYTTRKIYLYNASLTISTCLRAELICIHESH
jgi:hypothetical protein